jgi:hypothetical protein
MAKSGLAVPTREALKQHYDDRYAGDYMDADAYASWAHDDLAEYRVRQTLERVRNCPHRILDYGCGQGKWTTLLRRLHPQAERTDHCPVRPEGLGAPGRILFRAIVRGRRLSGAWHRPGAHHALLRWRQAGKPSHRDPVGNTAGPVSRPAPPPELSQSGHDEAATVTETDHRPCGTEGGRPGLPFHRETGASEMGGAAA